MPIDVTSLLASLRALAEGGRDVAALDLHLDALMAARDGDLARAGAAFEAARAWESEHGYADGALHTAHQMALTVNFGGDLRKLDLYYHETTMTLTRMKNRKGTALCLRSMGEIAILKDDSSELWKAWDLSERLFTMIHLPESSQMAAWRTCVRQILTHNQ